MDALAQALEAADPDLDVTVHVLRASSPRSSRRSVTVAAVIIAPFAFAFFVPVVCVCSRQLHPRGTPNTIRSARGYRSCPSLSSGDNWLGVFGAAITKQRFGDTITVAYSGWGSVRSLYGDDAGRDMFRNEASEIRSVPNSTIGDDVVEEMLSRIVHGFNSAITYGFCSFIARRALGGVRTVPFPLFVVAKQARFVRKDADCDSGNWYSQSAAHKGRVAL